MEARARSEVAARLRGSYSSKSESDGRKKKGEWGELVYL
jgi:hypothetical protein